jgi:hypothetical protein
MTGHIAIRSASLRTAVKEVLAQFGQHGCHRGAAHHTWAVVRSYRSP